MGQRAAQAHILIGDNCIERQAEPRGPLGEGETGHQGGRAGATLGTLQPPPLQPITHCQGVSRGAKGVSRNTDLGGASP